MRVQLTARVSNRSALGAKIEMRAGSLRQRLETYAATPAPAPADVSFGLGDRAGADVIRVLWPSGILQAEAARDRRRLRAPLTGTVKVEELDRKPSSCPYLFTWNGERFEFLTDFLGGGEMGYWLAPGVRNTPDPDEYVRIPRRQAARRATAGSSCASPTSSRKRCSSTARSSWRWRIPSGTEVYPNEGLRPVPEPLRLFVTGAGASARRRARRARPRRARSARADRSPLPGRFRARAAARLCRRAHADADPAAAGDAGGVACCC